MGLIVLLENHETEYEDQALLALRKEGKVLL